MKTLRGHALIAFLITVSFILVLQGKAQNISTFAKNISIGNGNQAVNSVVDSPYDVCMDQSGNIFISQGDKIRKVDSSGIINTFATVSAYQISSDAAGNIFAASNTGISKISPTGAISTIETFSGPGYYASWIGLAIDSNGDLYFSDHVYHTINKITPSGVKSVFAGTYGVYNGGPISESSLNLPRRMTIKNGWLYFVDDSWIYKISLTTKQTVFISSAHSPTDIQVDDIGKIYYTDDYLNVVKTIPTGNSLNQWNINGDFGGDGGPATNAYIKKPSGLALDASGDIYVADRSNNRVRIFYKNPEEYYINTFAGGSLLDGASAMNCYLGTLYKIAVDRNGNMFVGTQNAIRKINTSGLISTLIRTTYPITGLAIDSNDNIFYTIGFNTIDKIDKTSGVTSTFYSEPSNEYGQVSFKDIVFDNSGNLFSTNFNNIIKVSPAGQKVATNALSSTPSFLTSDKKGNTYFVRSGTVYKRTDSGSMNSLFSAGNIFSDADGNLFFYENGNIVKKWDFSTGIITSVAGNGLSGYSGDGGPAVNASLYGTYIGFDQNGQMFIMGGTYIRRVQAPQTITFNELLGKIFGDASFTLSANSSKNLPITFSSSNLSIATISGSTVTIVGAGTATITASQAGNDVIASASITRTLTVSKAPQTITFNPIPSKKYGDPAFTLNATSTSGLPVSFTSSDNTILSISGTTASILKSGGPVTITAQQSGNSNYNAAPDDTEQLTVNKASLTVTADNKSKTYGDANPTLTLTYNGFVYGETKSVLDVLPTATTTATNCSPVNTYPITPSGGSDNNYSFNYSNGTLTVSKRTITAKADPKTKVYSTPNPTLTITYSTFVCGDNASGVDNPPTPSTTATETSNVGFYPITLSGGSDNNYAFTLTGDNLEIVKATPLINFPAIPSQCPGTTTPLNATSNLNTPITYNSSNTSVATISGNTLTRVWTGTATITASQPGNSNYNAGSSSQPITVYAVPSFSEIKYDGAPAYPLDCTVALTYAEGGHNVFAKSTSSPTTFTLTPSTGITYSATGDTFSWFIKSTTLNYTLTMTATNGYCVKTACLHFSNTGEGEARKSVFEEHSSNEEGPDVDRITAYPNPANDFVTVAIPNRVNRDTPVLLYDRFGKIVGESTMLKDSWKTKIPTSDLSGGLYIVRVNIDGFLNTTKVTVVH